MYSESVHREREKRIRPWLSTDPPACEVASLFISITAPWHCNTGAQPQPRLRVLQLPRCSVPIYGDLHSRPGLADQGTNTIRRNPLHRAMAILATTNEHTVLYNKGVILSGGMRFTGHSHSGCNEHVIGGWGGGGVGANAVRWNVFHRATSGTSGTSRWSTSHATPAQEQNRKTPPDANPMPSSTLEDWPLSREHVYKDVQAYVSG